MTNIKTKTGEITSRQMKSMSVQDIADKVFGKCKDARKFILMCNLDPATGKCPPVVIGDLSLVGLEFGNGAGWARDDGKLGIVFHIRRPKTGGSISSVYLDGYKPQQRTHTRSIPDNVKKSFERRRKGECYCCGRKAKSGKLLEIDHRCGRYDEVGRKGSKDDPEYDSTNVNNYQILCKNCNNVKRERCSACKKTGNRFDARRFSGEKLGWHEGSRVYQGTCQGCILHGFDDWRTDHIRQDFDILKLLALQKQLENGSESVGELVSPVKLEDSDG